MKNYKLAYKICVALGLVVLLDNTLFVVSGLNVVPTFFLYTVGLLGSLDLLNFIIYLWSRSWIIWFLSAIFLKLIILKERK